MWAAPPITLTDEERVELSRRVAAHTTPVHAARRARIILLAADGVPSRQISELVGMHESNVAKWRNRFRDKGLEGLEDRPRGGPMRFGHDERLQLAAAATSERDPDDPVATWTYFELAQKLWAEGVQIPVSQLWGILTDMDIHLDRVRGWLNRKDDPTFWERVRDVCGLYLNPPERALVLSIDEKTVLQAKERKHPDQAIAAGRPRRREFEYIRHGTASLVAALEVHSGKVVAQPIDPTTPRPSAPFSKRSKPAWSRTSRSTSSSTTAPATAPRNQGWFAAHPRWVVHDTAPRQLGQPDRAVLLDLAAKSRPQRQLPLNRRPHRQTPRLHQRLRPDCQTLRLDLLRQALKVA